MRRAPISPQEMARRGWVRVDDRPWRKLSARWVHRDGWRLEHCGHPTANWPWALFAPDGAMVTSGLMGPLRRPDYGFAWRGLEQATAAVAAVTAAGGLEEWCAGVLEDGICQEALR